MPYYTNIYADDELPHRAKIVYLYLCDRADSNGLCWPSIGRIAIDLSISKSTVKRALCDLVCGGYVRKEATFRQNGSRTSNRYYIEK